MYLCAPSLQSLLLPPRTLRTHAPPFMVTHLHSPANLFFFQVFLGTTGTTTSTNLTSSGAITGHLSWDRDVIGRVSRGRDACDCISPHGQATGNDTEEGRGRGNILSWALRRKKRGGINIFLGTSYCNLQ